jgi:(p)ppGpp synthase/HD superfamily hydrolase
MSTSPTDSTAALTESLTALLNSLDLNESQRDQAAFVLQVASITHSGQTRPVNTPYIDHPLQVALSAAHRFGIKDVNLIIAALLHDTVEDRAFQLIQALGGQPFTDYKREALACIAQHFGDRVRDVVERLTNPDFNEQVSLLKSKGDSREPQIIKQALYQEHFLGILAEDPEAFLIKLADFGENALKLGQLPPENRAPLAKKYGPVILATISALEKLSPNHRLEHLSKLICEELRSTYQRDYGG